MTYSWGSLVPILTAEMAITIDISYFFSKRLPDERLYADRNSLLFRPFKFHTFPNLPWFSSTFQSKAWFRFFFPPTSWPPSPCLGLWPSRFKCCIFSWYKAIKSPENQSRHHAVHVTNFTAHSYNSQSRHKLGAVECVDSAVLESLGRIQNALWCWLNDGAQGGGVGWERETFNNVVAATEFKVTVCMCCRLNHWQRGPHVLPLLSLHSECWKNVQPVAV